MRSVPSERLEWRGKCDYGVQALATLRVCSRRGEAGMSYVRVSFGWASRPGLDLARLAPQVRGARKMAKMDRKRPKKQPGAGFMRQG